MATRPQTLDHSVPPCQYSATVLETPTTSGNRSRQTSGIFTSIGFPMASSGRPYNSLRAKTDSGLVAVSKCSPPFTGLALSKNLLGHIMQTLTRAPAQLRITVYRLTRHFTGPSMAYRLAYRGVTA
jgi:hypothetical protein